MPVQHVGLTFRSHALAPRPADAFAAARAWFATQGMAPFPFQEEVWAAYAGGQSGKFKEAQRFLNFAHCRACIRE
jgi:hypothetical protein